jgi:hypothetical protein
LVLRYRADEQIVKTLTLIVGNQDSSLYAVETASKGPHPESSRSILEQGTNVLRLHNWCIGFAKGGELSTVEPHQAFFRADP